MYRRTDVCFFTQFAVKTKFQGMGIGRFLMDMIENRAKELGAVEITLDTSEHAHHLIEIYKARNYKIVGDDSWETTNYKSVLMSKSLK